MRYPELPVEPADVDGRLIIGATDEAPEDEDRIHELVKRADAYIRERMETGDARAAGDRPYGRRAGGAVWLS